MAIVRPKGPIGGNEAVNRALADLLFKGPHALSPAGGAPPKTTQPVQLFTLGLEDIKDKTFMRSAKPNGWRYLIVNNGPIAVADVKQTKPDGSVAFRSLIRGPIADGLNAAANLVSQNYESDQNSYEVRIIEIPALYVSALWLHRQAAEIFVPFLEGQKSAPTSVKVDTSFVDRILQAAEAKKAACAREYGKGSAFGAAH